MALKLSSREYLLKPISNADLEAALRKVVGVVQEKQQKQKKQESTNTKEKRFWEDLLVQCLQENYWIEQAKKGGYCVPGKRSVWCYCAYWNFRVKSIIKKRSVCTIL